MERESFEDEEVAAYFNQHFVCIKVDREERPDIDAVYMQFCQALTGEGGWPLTAFLTPDQKPFFAGTYFPKHTRHGRIGLLELAQQIAARWQRNRSGLEASIEELTQRIESALTASVAGRADLAIADAAVAALQSRFDERFGGFGEAPKFPTPHNLMLLLRYLKQNRGGSIRNVVETTLDSMYRGGIYDHVGFGFCRYATDREWMVPHFEKMLYDNALLAMVYTEAYQVLRHDRYRRIACDVISYVLRDMTHPDGGFYSAEDADSEGEEGRFYLWTPTEVEAVLGTSDAAVYCQLYDIDEIGNFAGRSIPNLVHCADELVQAMWENPGTGLAARVRRWQDALRQARAQRIRPARDDKVLTAWNGLMIAALAKAGRVFQQKTYTRVATRAAQFIESHLVGPDGRLSARYRDGERGQPAFVDDYAFWVWALLELYETTWDASYLARAIHWQQQMVDRLWDADQGGFFLSGHDVEPLLMRLKEVYDGAAPSGNSVAALNLLRLGRFTADERWTEMGRRTLAAFAGEAARHPAGYAFYATALWYAHQPGREIIIVGSSGAPETALLRERLQPLFLPDTTTLFKPLHGPEELAQVAPYTSEYTSAAGKTTVYVCQNYACQAPTADVDAVIRALQDG
ncbi:MAG: thioredoxin domain-containing protein [Alicyclobacillus shizuokensis]|nr:thioredoxin domain-containing protein [Alicyclobacillus shizuokensis]